MPAVLQRGATTAPAPHTTATVPRMTADEARAALRAVAEPDRVPELARYFRAMPGGYGEGDRFIGVRVPQTRRVARAAARAGMTLDAALDLLRSDIHEERLLALLVMV